MIDWKGLVCRPFQMYHSFWDLLDHSFWDLLDPSTKVNGKKLSFYSHNPLSARKYEEIQNTHDELWQISSWKSSTACCIVKTSLPHWVSMGYAARKKGDLELHLQYYIIYNVWLELMKL